jgi:GAF domain-containing protein
MRSGGRRANVRFGLRDLGVLEGPDDPAFNNIVWMAARSVGAPLAMLLMADVERNLVRVRASFGFDGVTRYTEALPLGPSLTAIVMETGQCLAIPDMRLNPKTAHQPYLQALGATSLLVAPVTCPADRVVGSLAVVDRLPRIWTDDDVAILQGSALLCAQSILLRAALKTLSVVAREHGGTATVADPG